MIPKRLIPSPIVPQPLVHRRLVEQNEAPTAAFGYEVVGLLVEVENQSIDPDGSIVSYNWDWGDGEDDDTTRDPGSHTYATADEFTITLTIVDNSGGTQVVEHTFTTHDVPTDGPGRVYLPDDEADWVDLGLPAPLIQWNCQEASGDLIAAFGGPLALADANTGHLFQQTVTGWTAKAVGFAATNTGSWSTSDDSMDIAESESFACLVYAAYLPSTTGRRLVVLASGATTSISSNGNSTAKIRANFSSNAVNGASEVYNATTVLPFLIGRNVTAGQSRVFTSVEQINGTFVTTAIAGAFGIGGFGAQAETCRYIRVAFWKGADAETILAKTTLQTLRWDLGY